LKVLLLYGGRSAEHDVSVISSRFVGNLLKKTGHDVFPVFIGKNGGWKVENRTAAIITEKYPWRIMLGTAEFTPDVVFPVLHGPYGEDGTIQGLCRTAGWPCAGSGVEASAVAMNKDLCKRVVAARGIPVLPWISVSGKRIPGKQEVHGKLGYPVFVKPARQGSSVGISRVTDYYELKPAIMAACEYDNLILIEKGIENPREIEVALVSDGGAIRSSMPGEVIPGKTWYDYEAKYDCPESVTVIPAGIPASLTAEARTMAEKVFSILSCAGFARCDFLLDSDGSLYFNELNTIPGFTSVSMFPKLWEAGGVPPEEILNGILTEALERYSREKSGTGKEPV